MGLNTENTLFYFILLFVVSISQQEINVCGIAFRYQLPLVWLSSFYWIALLQKEWIAKVKGGIINLILRNYLVERYSMDKTKSFPNQSIFWGCIHKTLYTL
jgi:hypothetical protein